MRADPRRQKELGKIHLFKKHLALDDDTYRDLLERVAGCRTASDLDAAGRGKVLDELARLAGPDQPYPGKPRNLDVPERARLKKIEALLADQGLPWPYADAIAKRQTGRDRCTFLDNEQLAGVITALVNRGKKHGGRE